MVLPTATMTAVPRLPLLLVLPWLLVQAFPLSPSVQRRPEARHLFHSSPATSGGTAAEEADPAAVQWDLLQRYHAKGSWKGVWSTFDYMGDLVDETIASVDLHMPSNEVVQHTHTIAVGAKRSDCATCFDSMDTKTLPVATYTPETFRGTRGRPIRLASRSWVNGPTVLKSGAVATELILAYHDGRVRVVFQHAPVWPKEDVGAAANANADDAPSALPPPQGLKLFRVTVSREALRDQPPTAETEAAYWEARGNTTNQANDDDDDDNNLEKVVFYRPVPPFNWHKVWSGTSWTWGPSSGNRGWAIDSLEDGDDWHGSSPVQVWNMRLPGGLFLQSPRMITPDTTGLLRLAWMPNDEVLLRVEAGVLALQPMELKPDEDLEVSTVFAFEPPSLASLRCDVLRKTGDLQGEPQFVKDQKAKSDAAQAAAAEMNVAPATLTQSVPSESSPSSNSVENSASPDASDDDSNSREGPEDDTQSFDDFLQSSTQLFQSSRPQSRTRQGVRRRRSFRALDATVVTSPPSSQPSQSMNRIADHELLTKSQEVELARVMKASMEVQAKLRLALQQKEEDTLQVDARDDVEDDEDDDDWSELMGFRRSLGVFGDGRTDDDDENEDLTNFSVMDSASWYQQTSNINVDESFFSRRRTEENVNKEIVQDKELEILSDQEILEATGISRLRVQSLLLEGAVARDTLIRSNTRLVMSIAKKWAIRAGSKEKGLTLRQIYQGSWDRPSLDEAVQEGIVGLVQAVDRFDPERNFKLSTYATYYITNKIRRCFQAASTPLMRIPRRYYELKSKISEVAKKYHDAGKGLPETSQLAEEIGESEVVVKNVLHLTKPAFSLDAPRGSFLDKSGGLGSEVESLGLSIEDKEQRPEDWVELSFLRQTLETAMSTELTPLERDVLRLRLGLDDGRNRSAKEIFKEMGGLVSEASISTAVSRAYRKLRSPQSLATYKLLAYLDFAGIDVMATKLDL